jgi:hypothetical protein
MSTGFSRRMRSPSKRGVPPSFFVRLAIALARLPVRGWLDPNSTIHAQGFLKRRFELPSNLLVASLLCAFEDVQTLGSALFLADRSLAVAVGRTAVGLTPFVRRTHAHSVLVNAEEERITKGLLLTKLWEYSVR